MASVWPLLAEQSVPAFAQDWAWPLSRALAFQWLQAFVGMWDGRGFGQANALPWQTYVVVVETAFVGTLGSATGLAMWVAALLVAAGCTARVLLHDFGVRDRVARAIPALFYAFGPVPFVRLSAGHLAYLAAYAILPIAIVLGRRTIERAEAMPAVWLGLAIGLSGCQIQFVAIGWLAVVAVLPFATRCSGWWWRLTGAFGISLALQLQAVLPLLYSSTASSYAAAPALRAFEFNNSSPIAQAVVGLGYFTHTYARHALPGAAIALYAVTVLTAIAALRYDRRAGGYAVTAISIGALLTAGLYGPLGPLLAWSFANIGYAEIFRDLHYFAALTALGLTLCIGLTLQAHRIAIGPVAAAIVWICAPLVTGAALRDLLVPRAYVADALAVMDAVHARGPGRVLWLPAREPVGPSAAPNAGRDFVAYGPAGNPSVSDDHQNPELSYFLATLERGVPDWDVIASMSVRYVALRHYLRSQPDAFGTGLPMPADLSDAAMAAILRRSPRLHVLRAAPDSVLYELSGASGPGYPAHVDPQAVLYSQLRPGRIAIEPSQHLDLPVSRDIADPRRAWVGDALARRYNGWLPDAIAPFAWTLSSSPLQVALPRQACLLVAGVPDAMTLQGATLRVSARGTWQRTRAVPVGDSRAANVRVEPGAGGSIAAISSAASCPTNAGGDAYVVASGFDAGWRAEVGSAWRRPVLANGWAMAWPGATSKPRSIYLPAYAQAVGVALTLLIVAGAFALARRYDRTCAQSSRTGDPEGGSY